MTERKLYCPLTLKLVEAGRCSNLKLTTNSYECQTLAAAEIVSLLKTGVPSKVN